MVIDKYNYKEFPTSGILRIPKKFQIELGFHIERRVDIAYQEDVIFIRRENAQSSHNKRLISKNGYLKIPKEIIEIANITLQDQYCLFMDLPNKQLIVKFKKSK
ncbi:hypothetical protein [Paenisporosarcina quisquiliarum]|uniref:hypothetical protein n=1 Tax=Paenisporosarcina quisquiliarum TaxID=365346 RepID=UPI0037365B22